MANLLNVAKANVTNEREKQMTNLVNAINVENASLGSVIRSVVAIAMNKENDNCGFANLVLDTICKAQNAVVTRQTNDIKKCVIECYPYKDENGTMLHKVNGLYVPFAKYSASIIKSAYYNAIGVTKVDKEAKRATEEEITKANEKKEEEKKKKTEATEKAAKESEIIRNFYKAVMGATTDAEIITIVRQHKEANKK